jgi:hypothetical protein
MLCICSQTTFDYATWKRSKTKLLHTAYSHCIVMFSNLKLMLLNYMIIVYAAPMTNQCACTIYQLLLLRFYNHPSTRGKFVNIPSLTNECNHVDTSLKIASTKPVVTS